MERKVLGAKQKNILMQMKKKFIPVMTDNKEVYVYDTPGFKDFCELVEADCDTLCRLGIMYHGEIGYKTENGLYIATCIMMKDGCIVDALSMELESDEDFLGLYEKKESDNFFDDSVENIVNKLKDKHADIYGYIENEIISHIQDYDLEESARENIANDWIADNPKIAMDVAKDYLCDDDMKDLIKDMVDSL